MLRLVPHLSKFRKNTGERMLLHTWRKTEELENNTLFKTQGFINGEWIDGSTSETFEVTNPSTLENLGNIADLTTTDAKRAIEAASNSFNLFKTTTPRSRSNLLYKLYELMMRNQDDIAKLIVLENGKAYRDAAAEVVYAASFFQWFAEEAPRIYGDTIPSAIGNNRMLTIRQPIGVCGIMTPWNFPAAMITRKLGAAVAAGCTTVIKPASETPLTALAIAQLSQEAGFPKGVINVLPTSHRNTAQFGKLICEHPHISKVSFTGSTNVGKILMKQSSETLKKLSFELGGNAPFIVFEDANLDQAVEGAINCKLRGTGQTCVCANRIYVQESIYEKFAEKFTEKVKQLKLGDGLEEGVTQGPLIHSKAVEKVQDHVHDAKTKNARVLVGGTRATELGENFYNLTVLADVTQDMKVAHEETFGPLAPLIKFKSEQEVIAMANDTEFGLAGYFYSTDYARIFRVAEQLQVGMIGANTGAISEAALPFGGVKHSGFGREGSKYGIEDYTILKTLVIGNIN